jgi:hypothetical protein
MYPRVRVNDADLPAFAVVNQEHTRLKIITKVKFGGQTATDFEKIANVTDDTDMTIPFVHVGHWSTPKGSNTKGWGVEWSLALYVGACVVGVALMRRIQKLRRFVRKVGRRLQRKRRLSSDESCLKRDLSAL